MGRTRQLWTPDEITRVASHIRTGLSNGRTLIDLTYELAHELDRPASSIAAYWRTNLVSESDKVVRTDTRIGWSTRFQPDTLAMLRAMSDVLGEPQTRVVEMGLDALMRELDDGMRNMIMRRIGK